MHKKRHRLVAVVLLGALMIVVGQAINVYQMLNELDSRLTALEIGVMTQEGRLASLRADIRNLTDVTYQAFAAVQQELERWEIIKLWEVGK